MGNWETQKWKGENTWHENTTTPNIVWRQIPHETPPFINRSREFLLALQALFKSKRTWIHQFLNALLANTFPFPSVCLKEWPVVFHHTPQNMNPNINSCTTNSFCFPSTIMKLWKAESCSPQLASLAVPPALHEAPAVLIIQQTSGLRGLCNLAKLCNCSPKISCSNNQNSPFDCKKENRRHLMFSLGAESQGHCSKVRFSVGSLPGCCTAKATRMCPAWLEDLCHLPGSDPLTPSRQFPFQGETAGQHNLLIPDSLNSCFPPTRAFTPTTTSSGVNSHRWS